MYKLNLEKAEDPEIKLPSSVGLYEKQGISRKTSTPASLTMLKPSLKDFDQNLAGMEMSVIVW